MEYSMAMSYDIRLCYTDFLRDRCALRVIESKRCVIGGGWGSRGFDVDGYFGRFELFCRYGVFDGL
jgi:hypothetical protein